MRDNSANRLDPVRLRPPRPRSLLRYAVIAALLALAAAVLFIEPRPGTAGKAACPAGRGGTAAPSGSPADRRTGSLPVPRGHVGVPVQLAEPATAAVLRPGDRVDVVARTGRAGDGTPSASPGTADPPDGDDRPGNIVLARDVLVLAVNAAPGGSPDEGLVYLAVPKERAKQVATLAPEVAIGVTVRPG